MTKKLLVRDLLVHPNLIEDWNLTDWDLVIQQGYATGLLARAYSILRKNDLLKSIPDSVLWHFTSAYKLYLAHQLDIQAEIDFVTKALSYAKIQPVFLKGAAYTIAKDACHDGRLFVDIDIYVDIKELAAAEQVLKWSGWKGEELDAHDEKYYREWMHEIPPLTHVTRGMTLDVHHNLVPLTSRVSIDGKLMADSAKYVSSLGLCVLSPEDRVLHSSIHLLLDGEFEKGFRDLSDIDMLLREFSTSDNAFWHKLVTRAESLKVGRILYYCLRQTRQMFNTPVPDDVMNKASKYRPFQIIDWVMNTCFERVLFPGHHSCRPKFYNLASNFLFIRSHWIKMPSHILIPHLLYKAFVTPVKEWKLRKNIEKNDLTG